MNLKAIRLIFAGTKFGKKLTICLLFFLLTTTAGATEYIVSPCTSDQAGVSVNGEEVVLLEDTIEPYWHFLLWLTVMNILSVVDMLILPAKFLFAILGFRITECADVFENSNRARIYEYIKTRPGAYLGEIIEKAGLNRGAVRYHIKILKAHHKIEAYSESGKTRYFQNNSTYGEGEKKVVSALQNSTNQRIISEIQNGKCNTNLDLAREIGVSRATISWYVKNLKETGLIDETRSGRSIIYSINPSYETLIEKYG
ncbi:winged helix-turn-helix transcriptional regulator [Methanosarcina siciliae]|uniref:winged helix-turn-helix transcriptional regulator n=1 Tax=Methanosarcina siciliae TaxID=38027 RepID=UPI00064E28E8|nr:winged helix-turn-helix transcriptional regulator [Methanosarcina siciliae]